MRRRSSNFCSSRMALMSSPKTVMVPESGRMRPLASFNSTLLPLPAGPSKMRVSPVETVSEISLRTCLPSNPMETRANTSTGSEDSAISLAPEDTNHELADDEIDGNDQNRRHNHGLRRGAAYALGASACCHAVKTSDRWDDEAEDNRFQQPPEY